jgi:hypothetical protein
MRLLDQNVLPTDADSIGLPLFSFAILLAGVLVLANLVALAFMLRSRHRNRPLA